MATRYPCLIQSWVVASVFLLAEYEYCVQYLGFSFISKISKECSMWALLLIFDCSRVDVHEYSNTYDVCTSFITTSF